MRASTAFKRILARSGVRGIRVTEVEIHDDEVVIWVAPTGAPRCGTCGTISRSIYDHRRRRWRHHDMGGMRTYLAAEIRRVSCSACGKVRTEAMPFARTRARHTRAFEAAVVWSALEMNRTAAAQLWRVSWEAVDAIVARAVTGRFAIPARLRAIGVDERSWRRNKALTVVVDHDSGRVIWVAEGASGATLEAFFDEIGPEAAACIELVSMDMDRAWIGAVRRRAPQARICFDPFHVVALAHRALDERRRAVSTQVVLAGRTKARLRFALLRSSQSLSGAERDLIQSLAGLRRDLFDTWVLKEELADLYRLVAPGSARDYLADWIERARASGIPAMAMVAKTLNRHFDGVVAAVETGLSNARLEGFNAKIALINRRGYGHTNLEAFKKMIYLCCGGTARPASPWVVDPA